jgi:hypothetical protein
VLFGDLRVVSDRLGDIPVGDLRVVRFKSSLVWMFILWNCLEGSSCIEVRVFQFAGQR